MMGNPDKCTVLFIDGTEGAVNCLKSALEALPTTLISCQRVDFKTALSVAEKVDIGVAFEGHPSLSMLKSKLKERLLVLPENLELKNCSNNFGNQLSSVLNSKETDRTAQISILRSLIYQADLSRHAVDLQKQNQSSARLAVLGEMASGIAHEINTPLGAIQLNCEGLEEVFLGEKLDREAAKFMIDSIKDIVLRITKTVKALRSFSRSSANSPFLSTKVSDLLDSAIQLCAERFKLKGVDLNFKNELGDLSILCRESEIGQVILNLLNNARDAVEDLPEKWVTVHLQEKGENIQISVSDSGKGIAPDQVEKIFQPFYTSKDVGKGTGLGLPIVKGIVEAHGGKFYLDKNQPNTTFVVILPKEQEIELKAIGM